MSKALIIAQKEIGAYFKSPIAYIVLVVAVSVFNVFFFLIIDQNKEATLREMFQVMEFMFVFILPLLTMKAFAEENSLGTAEFLMTTPTTNTAIVLGKYLGCLAFYSLLLGITLVYYAIIEIYGNPDRWATFLGYGGVWLEGALFISIGILTSSWTKNQVVAAISAYMIIFALYFSLALTQYCQGMLEAVLRYAGTWSHSENLFTGILSSADIIYYLSGIAFTLLLTRLSIENRLWR